MLNKLSQLLLYKFHHLKVGLNNASVREKWLKKILEGLPDNLRILDAGAGELANKKYCEHLEYVSQDFCEYDGKGNTSALQTKEWDTSNVDIISDIAKIPENDNSFDVVLCSEVLEHLPDPLAALSEFKRLIKPDGILIVTAPFCSLTHFAPYHYASGFNKYYYLYQLEKLGFRIEKCDPNGNYFEYVAQEIRRIEKVGREYCNQSMTLKQRWAQRILLSVLSSMSANDKGSSEMLCFGYHIVAVVES